MRNKIKIILFIFLIALLYGCNKNNVTEPNHLNNLEGKWSCNFIYIPEIQIPEYETRDTLLSLLEFNKNSFSLIIDNPRNIFPEKKYSSQTIIHSGVYSIIDDTLKLFVSNDVPLMEKFIYSINNDSLNIFIAPKTNDDGSFSIRMNSFLWNYKLKQSGTFIRVNE